MPKYHNTDDGPKPCTDKTDRCPYAKQGDPHFTSKKDAQLAYDDKMQEVYGGVATVTSKSPKSAKHDDSSKVVDVDEYCAAIDAIREEQNQKQKELASKQGLVKPLPSNVKVTPELIGSPETDVDRIVYQDVAKHWGTYSHVWLNDTEGHTIAYIKVMKDDKEIALCDIEVRPEFRGRKLAKRLIEAVEKNEGQKIVHRGGYTPEGLRSIAPLFHNAEEMKIEQEKIGFNSMTFVRDWDHKQPEYPR